MDQNTEAIKRAIAGSLNIIEQEREQEIISRRFGLSGQKQTLEQIGEMLSITRERVRQLEKAILIRLRVTAEEGDIPELIPAEKLLVRQLTESGRYARIADLAQQLYGRTPTAAELAELVFLGTISPALTIINENDNYHASLGIAAYGDEKTVRAQVDQVVSVIKANKQPLTIEQLDAKLDYQHPDFVRAIARISKQIATLGSLWGLAKWSAVNPRNIRDKIYVVLESNKEPMHFTAIAKAIANSNFKRRHVTTQAIHNELIKDPRFILIGRGIYALSDWGYTKGTIAEIITRILSEAGEPLTREEVVKRVLRARKVKETTILLNLQNKQLFKKVDKDRYCLLG